LAAPSPYQSCAAQAARSIRGRHRSTRQRPSGPSSTIEWMRAPPSPSKRRSLLPIQRPVTPPAYTGWRRTPCSFEAAAEDARVGRAAAGFGAVAVGAEVDAVAVGCGFQRERRQWLAGVDGRTVLGVDDEAVGRVATGAGAQVVVAADRIGEQRIGAEVSRARRAADRPGDAEHGRSVVVAELAAVVPQDA